MRHSHDEYYMEIVSTVSSRSTCTRRSVGCVIVDSGNHIISTGYNGVPRGGVHCTNKRCQGAFYSQGERLDDCRAIHAEVNAICQSPSKDIVTIYISCSPCMNCMKMILSTTCRRIVFSSVYDKEALKYWTENGGKYEQLE